MNGVSRGSRIIVGISLLFLAAGAPLACGGDGEEDRARADREMDLAMEGDTAGPELRDVPQEEEAVVPPRQEERPQEPAPQPRRQAPRRAAPPPAPAPQPPAAAEREAEQAPPEPAPERAPPQPTRESFTAPAGATFRVLLNQELSTRSSQPGDVFTVRLVDAITDGQVMVVPAESVVRGRVTAVQKSGGTGGDAVIKLAFDEVLVEGEWFPIQASILEANPETKGRSSTGEKAAKIGGGAVAGAILGRVIGGNAKGTVIGAAVGAAAGTAIVLGTEDVDAVLPEGSRMTLRLDGPLTVSVYR